MRRDGAGKVSACAETHHANAVGIYPQLLSVVAKILEGSSTVIQRYLGITVREVVGQHSHGKTEVKVKRGPVGTFVATSNIGIAASGTDDDSLAVSLLLGCAEELERSACGELYLIDCRLLLHIVCQDFKCLARVEVAFLDDGRLVARVVGCPSVGADACLRDVGAVEDVAVHRDIIRKVGGRARVVHLNGLQVLVGADDVAPVVLKGNGVAVHERMLVDAVEISFSLARDESKLPLCRTDAGLHGAGHLAVPRAHLASRGSHAVLLVVLRLECVPLGQRVLHLNAVGLNEL